MYTIFCLLTFGNSFYRLLVPLRNLLFKEEIALRCFHGGDKLNLITAHTPKNKIKSQTQFLLSLSPPHGGSVPRRIGKGRLPKRKLGALPPKKNLERKGGARLGRPFSRPPFLNGGSRRERPFGSQREESSTWGSVRKRRKGALLPRKPEGGLGGACTTRGAGKRKVFFGQFGEGFPFRRKGEENCCIARP